MRKKKYSKITIIVICILVLFSGIIGLQKKYMNQIAPSTNVEVKEQIEQVYIRDYIENNKNYKKNKQVFFQNKQFDCIATFGFEGIIYRDLTFPVQISVTNKGKDMDGTICIIVPGREGKKGVSIVKEIQLNKNETKKVYLDVPKITTINQCKVMILEQEKVLLEKEIKDEFQYDDQGTVFLGVLSKQENQLDYMDQIVLSIDYESILRKISFSKETFPDDLEIMKHLQYIVFDSDQMIKLSDKQKNSLIQWIEQGGIVICYHAQDYNMLRSILQHNKIKEEEGICIQLEQSNLIVKNLAYELGRIIIFPKEITNKNKEVREKREFAETLFYELNNNKNEFINKGNRFSGLGYMMERVLEFHYNIKLPKTRVYFSILILYIICVAPIGYFVLKRVDKREWIGFWIIGFAVVFHSIILLVSSNSTLKEPVGAMVGIVDGSKNKWNETLYTSWINPTRYPYSIKLSKEYNSVYPYYDEFYGTNQKIRLEKVHYFMKKNEKDTQIVVGNSDIFKREFFIAERTYDENKIAFANELHFEKEGITGTVTNNTGVDLWGAGVYFDGYYISLGNWKSGETKNITLEQNYIIDDDKNVLRHDLVSILIKFIDEDRKKDIQTLRRTEDLYDFFKGKYIDFDFENAIIFGLSDEYKNVDKIATSVKTKTKTLYFTKTSGFIQEGCKYFIPNIMAHRVRDTGSKNFNLADNFYYGQDDTIIFQFKPDFEVIELYSSNLTTELKEGVDLSIYIWNHTTQKYDEIFKNTKQIGEEELKNYVKNNRIKLRFTSNSYGVELPKISAVGGEKNVGIKTTN